MRASTCGDPMGCCDRPRLNRGRPIRARGHPPPVRGIVRAHHCARALARGIGVEEGRARMVRKEKYRYFKSKNTKLQFYKIYLFMGVR